MMEFTLSRVCMAVCGVLMLAAVMVPFGHMSEMRTDNEMQALTDDIAAVIDGFDRSGPGSFTLSTDSIMPESSELRFDGNVVTLEKDGKIYRSITSVSIEKGVFGKGDIIVFHRTAEGLSAGSIYDR